MTLFNDELDVVGDYWRKIHIDWIENWDKHGFKSQDEAIELVGKDIKTHRDFSIRVQQLLDKIKI